MALILLIEDESLIRQVSRDLLDLLGHQVVVASGGKEGLAIYSQRAEEIDLVLVDIHLPDLPGRKVLDQLQRIKPDGAILICSGRPLEGAAARLVESGRALFIQKPFRLANLEKALNQLLGA